MNFVFEISIKKNLNNLFAVTVLIFLSVFSFIENTNAQCTILANAIPGISMKEKTLKNIKTVTDRKSVV